MANLTHLPKCFFDFCRLCVEDSASGLLIIDQHVYFRRSSLSSLSLKTKYVSTLCQPAKIIDPRGGTCIGYSAAKVSKSILCPELNSVAECVRFLVCKTSRAAKIGRGC